MSIWELAKMRKALWTTLAALAAIALGGCETLSDIPISIGKPKPAAVHQQRPQPAKDTPTTGEESMLPSWINIGKPPSPVSSTIQDHAVLQRDKPIPLWGRVQPGQDVTVTMAGEQASTTADDEGNWHLTLAARKAGGPYQMTVSAGSVRSQIINDVMVGDVYLCSGQSNMEWPVIMAMHGAADAAAAANPMIRILTVHRAATPTQRTALASEDRWSVADPESVKSVSAVCYFFGRDLQPKAGVALGLIESYWGGSPIQAWMSRGALDALGNYGPQLNLLSQHSTSPQQAEVKWREFTDAWWRAHDPAMPGWSDAAYDDSAWSKVVPTGSWKDWDAPALTGFDGIVWFRATVSLNAAQRYGPAQLSLGTIDQTDKTFVNGVEVGGSEGWNNQRSYTIPEGILHEGDNVIAVAVYGGDGMSGPIEQRKLNFANGTSINLNTPWRYRISVDVAKTGAVPHTPWLRELGLTTLYNGMIAPLGPTPLRGVVWYQGESNTAEVVEYRRLLNGLIVDWRRQFGEDAAFLLVQLPGYGPINTEPRRSDWAALREVQRQVANTTPKTGLAVTVDLGDRANLHPVVKQEVGRRLALIAERMIYGQDVVDSGPTPVSAVRSGNTVAVRFANLAQGFRIYEAGSSVGFQVCNAMGRCDYVSATVGRDEIDLDVSRMSDVAEVRFCWGDSPICNVYNSAGLPAVPFEMAVTPATQPTPANPKQSARRTRPNEVR
jgi:sialate O-acetylesterase